MYTFYVISMASPNPYLSNTTRILLRYLEANQNIVQVMEEDNLITKTPITMRGTLAN